VSNLLNTSSKFGKRPICQQISKCPTQRTIPVAAVQATDEQLIPPSVSDANFCPPRIFLHQTCTVGFAKYSSTYVGYNLE